jgi:nitroreductase
MSISQLLNARYGSTEHPLAQLSAEELRVFENQTFEGLLKHRSIRAFDSRPVPEHTVEMMVAAAQSASTSSNFQTWSVVSVTDPERKARLNAVSGQQKQIDTCPLFLVWIADLARLRSLGEQRQVPHGSLDYLEAFLLANIDATLASQNAAVAAEAAGLGVVYIGGIRNSAEVVAKELGLPSSSFASFGMCVGYPDPQKPASIKPRLPMSAVLHKEQYNPQAFDQATKDYNLIMNRFYTEQKMNTPGEWDLHTLSRLSGEKALRGREKLKTRVNELGFELK